MENLKYLVIVVFFAINSVYAAKIVNITGIATSERCTKINLRSMGAVARNDGNFKAARACHPAKPSMINTFDNTIECIEGVVIAIARAQFSCSDIITSNETFSITLSDGETFADAQRRADATCASSRARQEGEIQRSCSRMFGGIFCVSTISFICE